MGTNKKAAQTTKPATPADDGVENAGARAAAKGVFVSSVMDMGWKLALTVLIPVFIGVQIDKKYHQAPSFTLAALFIAIGGSAYIVYKTIQNLNTDIKPNNDKDNK